MAPRVSNGLLVMSLLVLFSLFSTLAHTTFWERRYDAGPSDHAARSVATLGGAS